MPVHTPHGTRPTCTGIAAARYGAGTFADHVERSNREIMSIGLVEDREVVENIETTLDGCGLDAVMPGGVGDLASSYGLHGQGSNPVILDAVAGVIGAAKAAGIKSGVYLSDLKSREKYVDLEPDFYVYSIDYKLLQTAYSDIRRSLCI